MKKAKNIINISTIKNNFSLSFNNGIMKQITKIENPCLLWIRAPAIMKVSLFYTTKNVLWPYNEKQPLVIILWSES